jgi:hypothetical protein
MRNLDITDTRDKLGIYSAAGLLVSGGDAPLPSLRISHDSFSASGRSGSAYRRTNGACAVP